MSDGQMNTKQPVNKEGKTQHETCHGCGGPHISVTMWSCNLRLLQKK